MELSMTITGAAVIVQYADLGSLSFGYSPDQLPNASLNKKVTI